MNYAILRLAKRSLPAARAMAAHALRERPTRNADPARAADNRVFGAQSAAATHARLRTLTDALAKRKDAVRCVELFIGMSPEAARDGGPLASQAAQRRYFEAALGLVASRFGGHDNIVLIAEHRDETTPHLQVLLAPIERDEAGQPLRLAANAMIGGPAGLRRLQDELGRLAEPFGLRRGERGSTAKHTSIRSFYGALMAAGRPGALPARVPVPTALPPPAPPGRFASAAKRAEHATAAAEHARREAERKEAVEANARRQAEVERLARVGLGVHGQERRQLPAALSGAERTLRAAKSARAVIVRAQQLLDQLTPQQQETVLADARQAAQEPAKAKPAPSPARARSGRPRPT